MAIGSGPDFWKRGRTQLLSPLALRLAIPVGIGLAICGLLVSAFVSNVPFWLSAVVIPLVAGLLSYLTSRAILTTRLTRVEDLVQRIREHQFDEVMPQSGDTGDELESLVREISTTGRSLQKDFERRRLIDNHRKEFLGNVSHELKTPIFAIQGFSETLLDGALDDERVSREFVQKIQQNAARLASLTSDLAEVSRIETGELKMSSTAFEAGNLLREIVDSLEHVASQRGISLSCKAYDPCWVWADFDRIRQVIVNLAHNAILYNRDGGQVECGAASLPSGASKVWVTDTGIGIDAKHIPRLTERFFRIDRSRSRSEGGTGLGLAIVKHILEAHGQKLLIESVPGRGSTFSFQLDAPPDTADLDSDQPTSSLDAQRAMRD